MRKTAIFAFLLLVVPCALAQFTTVTGTVVDPHNVPYALGTITPLLVTSGTPTLNGLGYSPPSGPVNLDINGHFAFNVADNTQLQPAGTKWNFTVCSATGTVNPAIGTGSQCFTLAAPITISGSTQNISTQLNAVALALTIPIGTGGGNIAPGTANSQFPSWVPSLSTWEPQNKAIYDTRDFMTCNTPRGSSTGTNVTSAFSSLITTIGTSQHATIRVIGSSNPSDTCLMATLAIPSNITLDFSGGGAFTLITDTTPPGGMTFDASGSGASFNTSSSTCSVTVTPSAANETYMIFTAFGFGSGALVNPPTSSVSSDVVLLTPSFQSNTNASMLTDTWIVASVAAGSRTFTWNYHDSSGNPLSTWNDCHAIAVAGAGVTPNLDGLGGSTANCGGCTGTPMTATATFQSGSFLLSYGGQHATTETCTSGGGGFTQPAGSVGQNGTSGTVCTMYINSSSVGSITANQNLSSTPTGLGWTYSVIGMRPGSATLNILGGINDPDLHQIFYNAFSGTGTIDFTGGTILYAVYPEWWGAGLSVAATTNTSALQAAINGAYGKGRTNATGLSVYNRPLYLTTKYNINGELQMYDTINFRMDGAGRLLSGIVQTATNKRIIDGECNAYGEWSNLSFTTTATQDSTHPLLDIDKDGVTCPSDLAPQFLDFYNVTFNGNNVGSIGLLGAKSGGAAQFSNVYCYDCNALGFSTAGWQIGEPLKLAQNALAIAWYGGDMQAMPGNGFANYGGGFEYFFGTSFEAGYQSQTGADVYSQDPQGPVYLYGIRSESRVLCLCTSGVISHSQIINQDQVPNPGVSFPVNTYMTGSYVGGDGAHYKVTIDGGPFGGFGTQTNQQQASGGSTSTLSDTNESLTGSVTVLTPIGGETVTQAVTGSTATLLSSPALPSSLGTITGSVTSGTFQFNEIIKQSVTNVTATEQAPSPVGSANLFANNFSGTADASHTWVGQTSGAVYTPTAAPTFSATTMYITAATGSPDNSHTWTGGTSGFVFTPTSAPAGVNWTVNAFAGMTVSNFTGTNALCYATIASNTSTTITISGSWITRYPPTFVGVGATQVGGGSCSAPDNTTTFAVEPGWNHGTVTSGGMTLAYSNENVVGGASDAPSFSGRLEDDELGPGGQLNLNPDGNSGTIVLNTVVNRPDWYSNATAPQLFGPLHRDWDIRVTLPGTGFRNPILWTYPTVAGGLSYNLALRRDMGAEPICWNTGTVNVLNNVSANEVCAGGRSDPLAGTSVSRSLFEIRGTMGPPTPYNQTNANGSIFRLQGGLPTGNGSPADIAFSTGNSGSSGNSISDGTDRWLIKGPTGHLFTNADNTYDIGASAGNRPRNIYAGTGFTGPLFSTTTNCAQSGTAANPSVVSCTTAASGAVACSVSASAGTCVVNTTAVGANSRIFVQETTSENTSLGVTCNTSPTVLPAIAVASKSAGVSFTINMPTISTNPACFDYWIVNQ